MKEKDNQYVKLNTNKYIRIKEQIKSHEDIEKILNIRLKYWNGELITATDL